MITLVLLDEILQFKCMIVYEKLVSPASDFQPFSKIKKKILVNFSGFSYAINELNSKLLQFANACSVPHLTI